MPEVRTDATRAETSVVAPGSGTVVVRYWAAARAAAGRAEDAVPGARTVQQALDAVVAMRPGDDRFARVLEISSLLLADRPVRREGLDQVPVAAGDVVEVLPPFAGG
jgi:molybdopterin converting factor small subunit